jgi:hypothetical protein
VPLDDGLLLVHAVATAWLAGLVWTVQLVVYPGFGGTGPTAAWVAVHDAPGPGLGRRRLAAAGAHQLVADGRVDGGGSRRRTARRRVSDCCDVS